MAGQVGFVVDGPNSFISKLTAGGARASLFEATISMARKHNTGTSGAINFYCKGIQIPANTIGVTQVMYKGRAVKMPGNRSYDDLTTTIINDEGTQVMYKGRAVKMPGNRSYDDLTTTIINDEGYVIRNQVENWMSKLNSHAGNVRASTHMAKLSGYTATMMLKTFTKAGATDGNVWRFKNCWPTSIDQIDVNWEPNDAVMEFTVNWAYDYWVSEAL